MKLSHAFFNYCSLELKKYFSRSFCSYTQHVTRITWKMTAKVALMAAFKQYTKCRVQAKCKENFKSISEASTITAEFVRPLVFHGAAERKQKTYIQILISINSTYHPTRTKLRKI